MTRNLMRKLMMAILMVLLAVAAAKPVDVEAMPRPCGKYAWTQTDMCLRSYNGLGGNIVAVVPKGAEVVVLTTDDNSVDGFYWARVQYSGAEGYMAYANENQTLSFLEFQSWNSVEGTSGWARLLRGITLYSGPNPELSGELAQLEPGRELYIQTEMSPVKYGSNICRVWVDGVEGFIPANNSAVEIYEYMAVPNDMSYIPATAPTQSESINKRGIVKLAMNLREHPTTNSEILKVLNTYEEVWIESLETTVSGEKWFRVNTGTMSGYVRDFGITVGQTLDRFANTITAVNLRTVPTTNSQILVTIPNSYKIWAVTRFNGVGNSPNPNWVHVSVRINGKKIDGYVIDLAIK